MFGGDGIRPYIFKGKQFKTLRKDYREKDDFLLLKKQSFKAITKAFKIYIVKKDTRKYRIWLYLGDTTFDQTNNGCCTSLHMHRTSMLYHLSWISIVA